MFVFFKFNKIILRFSYAWHNSSSHICLHENHGRPLPRNSPATNIVSLIIALSFGRTAAYTMPFSVVRKIAFLLRGENDIKTALNNRELWKPGLRRAPAITLIQPFLSLSAFCGTSLVDWTCLPAGRFEPLNHYERCDLN